jgi:hypothetical protein
MQIEAWLFEHRHSAPEPEHESRTPALSVPLQGVRQHSADLGYCYALDGQEYTPEDAERITAERDSGVGWTWWDKAL